MIKHTIRMACKNTNQNVISYKEAIKISDGSPSVLAHLLGYSRQSANDWRRTGYLSEAASFRFLKYKSQQQAGKA